MTVFTLLEKKGGKWAALMVGENYKEQREKFLSILTDPQDREAILLVDSGGGELKRKIFGSAQVEAAKEEPKEEKASKAKYGSRKK